MQVALFETADKMGQGNTDLQGRLLMRVPEVGRRLPADQKMGLVWAYAPGHQIATANAWPASLARRSPSS